MTNLDEDAFLSTVVCDYAWNFRTMLSDIQDFLDFSERTIEWQFRTTQQSIRRRCQPTHFDLEDLAQLFEENELQKPEHRFTVALPMQLRYGALGALTNTIEWAAHFFQQSWNNSQSPLPKEFRNNPEITALKLLEHFDVLMSLDKATVVTDYRNLVVVRNAVVHIGGIVRDLPKQKRAELQKAVESLKGFRIANWHFLGECVEIDRDALDPYIESMGQLLFEIYKTADEKGLLLSREKRKPS